MVKELKRKNILKPDEVLKRPRILPEVRISDAEPIKNEKWINRERVLYSRSRGLSYKGKQLMKNLIRLSPHSKVENTLDVKANLKMLIESAEIRNCSKIVHFEARKNTDLYLWMSDTAGGPSVKFLVKNFEFCENFKFTGNCLKGSRPLLSFSAEFDQRAELRFVKEMCGHIFGVPNHHPKSQPFIDRVYSFSIVNGNIVFRHYQIVDAKAGELVEIGPRMLLEPIKIFEESLGGRALYSNEEYVTPNQIRSTQRHQQMIDRAAKTATKVKMHKKAQIGTHHRDETEDVFFD